MDALSQTKRRMQALGTILAMLLVGAGTDQASAQEMYKLSAELHRASLPTQNVSMGGRLAFPEREALGESTVVPGLKASMLDRPSLPERGGVKETRESVLEQIAALGGFFGKELKSASSRCTGWQGGGFEQPWIGPDPMIERACLFQFELPTR